MLFMQTSWNQFVARFVARIWYDNYDSLLSHLNWPELSTRRRKSKLLLCNRILKGCSILPPSLFTPIHPHTSDIITRLPCSYHPTCRSTAHLSMQWHCAPSLYSFKKRFKFLYNSSIATSVGAWTLFCIFTLCFGQPLYIATCMAK